MKPLKPAPLTAEAFAPFGTVIEKPGADAFAINDGHCIRHNALATVDVAQHGGTAIVSIFAAQPYALPLTVGLVERHPLGSQAFYPLGHHDWLVLACSDEGGRPVDPTAFLATASQGINFHRNVWHGVLTPLYEPCDFLVVDRAGPDDDPGDNLEEYRFEIPERIVIDL